MSFQAPVERARVFKQAVPAATLTRTAEGVSFEYRSEYLDAGGPAVATTLPVNAAATITASGAVPPFFAGLLPEGPRLSALRRALKVSADDELSLLCAVGGDTIGDVQVYAEGTTPAPVPPVLDIPTDSAVLDFAALVGDAAPVDRVGLPGVQEKVSGRMIAVPASRAGERYILKLNPPEFPHVVENEALMIEVARECRLPVVEARVLTDAHGRKGLFVKRFDRVPEPDGSALMVPTEDGCQVMARWPADKYSVSAEALAAALTSLCAARLVAARDIFRQFVFAILTGNGDLHAKNLSIRSDGGEWMIAPAYDLPSTVLYGDTTLALPMQRKRTGLSRRIVLDFAESIGLRRLAARRWLDDLLDGTEPVIDLIEAGRIPVGDDAIRAATRELRYRRRLLTEGT